MRYSHHVFRIAAITTVTVLAGCASGPAPDSPVTVALEKAPIAVAGPVRPLDEVRSAEAPLPQPCFNDTEISTFQARDDGSLELLTTERQNYVIRLESTCPALKTASRISFQNLTAGQVCGTPGELLVAGSEICPIAEVSPQAASEQTGFAN